MKKTICVLLAALILCALAACGAGAQKAPAETPAPAAPETSSPAPEAPTDTAEPAEPAPADGAEEHGGTLVVYFSATGTTKGIAEKIASITDADLYEITAAEPYSAEDLNYNDRNSRTTKEQNDKSARPEIGSEPVDLSGYRTVYLGFPIWWGRSPASWTPLWKAAASTASP